MPKIRVEVNDYIMTYINQMTGANSPYSTHGEFIKELIRDHMRANVGSIKQAYDQIDPVQRAEAGKAAMQGVKQYRAWKNGALYRNPGLKHAIEEIDRELTDVAREADGLIPPFKALY